MVTGNTETGITVTYEDSDGTLDFVAADASATNEIQTLSEVLSEGNDGGSQIITGVAMLTIEGGSPGVLEIEGNAADDSRVEFKTGNANRWWIGRDGGTESGSNAGSNFL